MPKKGRIRLTSYHSMDAKRECLSSREQRKSFSVYQDFLLLTPNSPNATNSVEEKNALPEKVSNGPTDNEDAQLAVPSSPLSSFSLSDGEIDKLVQECSKSSTMLADKENINPFTKERTPSITAQKRLVKQPKIKVPLRDITKNEEINEDIDANSKRVIPTALIPSKFSKSNNKRGVDTRKIR